MEGKFTFLWSTLESLLAFLWVDWEQLVVEFNHLFGTFGGFPCILQRVPWLGDGVFRRKKLGFCLLSTVVEDFEHWYPHQKLVAMFYNASFEQRCSKGAHFFQWMKLDKYMTGSEIGSSKLVDAGSCVSVRLSWLILINRDSHHGLWHGCVWKWGEDDDKPLDRGVRYFQTDPYPQLHISIIPYNYQPTWGWNIALMKISLVYDMCRFEEKPFEGYPSF